MHKQHTASIGYHTNLLTVLAAILELAAAKPHSLEEANEILHAIEERAAKATLSAPSRSSENPSSVPRSDHDRDVDLHSSAWDAVEEYLTPEQN